MKHRSNWTYRIRCGAYNMLIHVQLELDMRSPKVILKTNVFSLVFLCKASFDKRHFAQDNLPVGKVYHY